MSAEVERRAQLFRQQIRDWSGAGRPGVPVLALPGVVPAPGACVSCGGPRENLLRCAACLEAVNVALGTTT